MSANDRRVVALLAHSRHGFWLVNDGWVFNDGLPQERFEHPGYLSVGVPLIFCVKSPTLPQRIESFSFCPSGA